MKQATLPQKEIGLSVEALFVFLNVRAPLNIDPN